MPEWVFLAGIVTLVIVLLILVAWWRVEALTTRDKYALMKGHLKECQVECREQECGRKEAESSLSASRCEIGRIQTLNELLAKKIIPEAPDILVDVFKPENKPHLIAVRCETDIQTAFEICKGDPNAVDLYLAQQWSSHLLRQAESQIVKKIKKEKKGM